MFEHSKVQQGEGRGYIVQCHIELKSNFQIWGGGYIAQCRSDLKCKFLVLLPKDVRVTSSIHLPHLTLTSLAEGYIALLHPGTL